VTDVGLKTSPLVAVTVPCADMAGEEGLGPQAQGNKTNKPKQPNQNENILFTATPQKIK